MDYRISELTSASAVNGTDLIETAVVDGGSGSGYSSKKHALSDVANFVQQSKAFSTTARKVGTFVDGKDIFFFIYVFTVNDFHGSTIDNTTMKGQLWLDVPVTYDRIWIDYGNSFLMNTNKTTSNPKSHPLNYLAYGAGTFTRTNIQKTSSNDGKPFVYFENTYTASEWYSIRSDLRWYIVIRWTEE